MGKEPEIAPEKYAKAPERKVAHHMLRDIEKKPVFSVRWKVDKQMILYGASALGEMAKEYFERLGIPFFFVMGCLKRNYAGRFVTRMPIRVLIFMGMLRILPLS